MRNEKDSMGMSENDRQELISRFVDELPVLRVKLGMSQDELSNIVGISRQTYSSMETKRRKMSWSVYLSLVLVFDNNEQTHEMLRKEGLFPDRICSGSKSDGMGRPLSSFITIENEDIRNHLDDQAIHAIETVVMVEYARCNKIPGEAVIKAFDGRQLTKPVEEDAMTQKALNSIKAKSAADMKDG